MILLVSPFYIQAGSPVPLSRKNVNYEHCGDEYFERLHGMIDSSFPMLNEELIVFWAHESITFNYRYDAYRLIPDMISIIEGIRSQPSGSDEWCFGIQGYMPIWVFEWADETLLLSWRNYQGDDDSKMRGKPPVTLRTRQFINEWKRPMEMCLRAIVACGFDSIYPETVNQFRSFIQSIPGNGFLYPLENVPNGYFEMDVNLSFGYLVLKMGGDDVAVTDFNPDIFSELLKAALTLENATAPISLSLRQSCDVCTCRFERNCQGLEIKILKGTREPFYLFTTWQQFASEVSSLAVYLRKIKWLTKPVPEIELLRARLQASKTGV